MAKKKQEAKLKEPVRIRGLSNLPMVISLSIWTITLVMLFFGMKTR